MKIYDRVMCQDDVMCSIDENVSNDVRELYKLISNAATAIASAEESLGQKVLIDMSKNEEGLPHADFFRNGKCYRQIFASTY